MHPTSRFNVILLFVILLVNTLHTYAQESDWNLHGNEPEFANNILLTIDDASIEANVRSMFNILQKHEVKATFFPNICYIQQQDPQLWRDIAAAGHEIGYHTRNHYANLTLEQLTQDFALFQEEIRTILGDPSYTIRYVRPPKGVWNEDWMAWANANHLYTVRWNVTSVTKDMPYVEGVINNRTAGGSIILLHADDSDVDWLHDYLPTLKSLRDANNAAYRITTLSDAFND